MKKSFLIFSFLPFSAVLSAQTLGESDLNQSVRTFHNYKDVTISVSPNVLLDTPNGKIFAGGIKLKVFVAKRFSFDSDLLSGKNFIQLGPGLIGLSALLLGYDWSFGTENEDHSFMEFLIVGISVLLSAEHFSYHITVTSDTEISPYVSLL
jgi:FAD synthase